MTTTEALPSIYAIFLLPFPGLVFGGLFWFINRAYSKTNYDPAHWKDLDLSEWEEPPLKKFHHGAYTRTVLTTNSTEGAHSEKLRPERVGQARILY